MCLFPQVPWRSLADFSNNLLAKVMMAPLDNLRPVKEDGNDGGVQHSKNPLPKLDAHDDGDLLRA